MNIPRENCSKIIIDCFKPGSKTLGKDFRINFRDAQLAGFLEKLDEGDLQILIRKVIAYRDIMTPLAILLDESNNSFESFLRKQAWSVIATLAIISTLESLLKEKKLIVERSNCFDYVRDNLSSIKTKKDINLLKAKYYGNYLGKSTVIANFLEKNLESDELRRIVDNYKYIDRVKNSKSIKDVINDLYGKVRSGFVHELKRDELTTESFSVDLRKEDMSFVISPNLSINEFLYYGWVAIFRSFGFIEGDMDMNFSKEEVDNGFSVDGSQIVFPLNPS